jgi:hypothetical protein
MNDREQDEGPRCERCGAVLEAEVSETGLRYRCTCTGKHRDYSTHVLHEDLFRHRQHA